MSTNLSKIKRDKMLETISKIKENIEDGIEYDPEKDKNILTEEEVVAEDDLADGYGEDVNDDILLDEEEVEDSDELFERLDDEGDEAIFNDSDLD